MKKKVELADGKVQLVEIVRPIVITFANWTVRQDTFVIPGGEPLIGAIVMEEMDVVLHPKSERMIVNPDNPNIPKLKLK